MAKIKKIAKIAQKIKYPLLFVAFLFLFFGLGRAASAATMYFSPASGSKNVGEVLSVSVYVSSVGQAMNAAEGVISFPPDKLEVASLSKAGSIFSLWVQEPAFSNAAGTVNFEGLVLNPGFSGSAGKILTVVFKAKTAGVANLTFTSGAVLANDGQGTNILTGLSTASFSLGMKEPTPSEVITPPKEPVVPPKEKEIITPPKPSVVKAPSAPIITSSTHPDSDKWYARNSAELDWGVSKDITAVRLLVGKIPEATPTITYSPPISHKEVKDLEDGVWYFHVRSQNAQGWSPISHFTFQIDTQKPNRFDIIEVGRKNLTEPKASFRFDAADETSGIDHYEIQIDDKDKPTWKDDGTGIYVIPVLESGQHKLVAKAVDKAGNALEKSIEFTIAGLEPPVIIECPRTLASGETLIVQGTTAYPGVAVTVWWKKTTEEVWSQSVKSDAKGNFALVVPKGLTSGSYKLWAEVTDKSGIKSRPSDSLDIMVKPPMIIQIGAWTGNLLPIAIPFMAIVLILILIACFGWYKFRQLRKKLRKGVRETERALRKNFDLLKEDMHDQIKALENIRNKEQMTKEKDKIVRRMRKNFKSAEKLIGQEIEEIEREIN